MVVDAFFRSKSLFWTQSTPYCVLAEEQPDRMETLGLKET